MKGSGITLKQPSNNRYRPRARNYRSPYQEDLLISMALTLVLAVAFAQFLRFPLYLAYMIGLNIVTFGCYGYDKYQAIHKAWRVPEFVLHFLAIIGGALGGITGQWFFNHKTRKQNFHIVLWSSFMVHIAILVLLSRYLLTYYIDLLALIKR
jgi:uncharacterized membrane protein YsdA (DUF1294 family)